MFSSTYNYLFFSVTAVIICCIISHKANAQIYDHSQAPPGVQWMQINTSNFQILYPSEFESEAFRVANTLEHFIDTLAISLNVTPKKITLILQNQGVISNGFVQLAPRRTEFYTTPGQDAGMQDWLNRLAVHELRHLVQFDKLTGKLTAPFFEELALAMFGISLPAWFFEGDAVGIETTLSPGGRGRIPGWEMVFRTNTLSGRKYSYSKNYLGSLRDRTPGYYELGYFMTTKLKRDYGIGIIDSILSSISAHPLRPYSMTSSLKKLTGLSTRALHDSTVSELAQLWSEQARLSPPEDYIKINKRTTDVPTDYLLPVSTSSGELIALKTGLSETPVLVKLETSGQEIRLLKIGYQTEYNFSYSSGKIVWDEFRYDARFHKRSHSVVNIYDLEATTYKQLTHKSRLFSPTLSPDAKKIAAVRVGLDNRFSVCILDAESGRQLDELFIPANYTLQTPSYHEKGKRLVVVAIGTRGASLLEFDLRSRKARLILPFQQQQISRPVYVGDKIVFGAHFNGINNIYMLDSDQKLTAITSTRYGASNPSYSSTDSTIAFNIYTPQGYDVASIPAVAGKRMSSGSDHFIDYTRPIRAADTDLHTDSIVHKSYAPRPYRPSANLFYFHSLSPIAEENPFNDELNIGLKLKSDNKLNTFSFYAGYQYNSGLGKSEYLAGLSYRQFYPILNLKYINRARLSYAMASRDKGITGIPVNFRENFVEAGLTVPLVFNRLNDLFNIELGIGSSYSDRYHINNRPDDFASRISFPMNYSLLISRNSRQSARDIAPRWRQSLFVSYQNLPFDSRLNGSIFRFQSYFYTPGLFLNHSLQLNFNYQQTDGVYRYNIDIPRISGYMNIAPSDRLRNTLLIDYRLPLLYPDAELGPLAYIKRIRGGLFADFRNIGNGNPVRPETFGLELNADMNLLRFYAPAFTISGRLILVNKNPPWPVLAEAGITYSF